MARKTYIQEVLSTYPRFTSGKGPLAVKQIPVGVEDLYQCKRRFHRRLLGESIPAHVFPEVLPKPVQGQRILGTLTPG